MTDISYEALLPKALDDFQRAELAPELVSVWDASVRSSHDFLSEEEIDAIRPEVAGALLSTGTLLLAYEGGCVRGFCGVSGDMVEALFVHPDCQGLGVGGSLCRKAINLLGARRVDVNEQNLRARAFYERIGFAVSSRSETDDAGRPYPILHMELAR